jgi:uncharacterized protein (TIGR03067 family)
MKTIRLPILFAAVLAMAPAPADDRWRIQGEWALERVLCIGNADLLPGFVPEGDGMFVWEGSLTFAIPGGVERRSYRIDPCRAEPRFDMDDGLGPGQPAHGIYQLRDDSLMLTFTDGKTRPVRLEMEDPQLIYVFRRPLR